LQTEEIYFSYYRLNANKFSKKIKIKLDKHFGFVKRCCDHWNVIWEGLDGFRNIEDDFMENSFIEKETRKIQHDIKEIFNNWSRDLKKIITTFHRDYLEDDNGHVGRTLQSLCQIFASGFD